MNDGANAVQQSRVLDEVAASRATLMGNVAAIASHIADHLQPGDSFTLRDGTTVSVEARVAYNPYSCTDETRHVLLMNKVVMTPVWPRQNLIRRRDIMSAKASRSGPPAQYRLDEAVHFISRAPEMIERARSLIVARIGEQYVNSAQASKSIVKSLEL